MVFWVLLEKWYMLIDKIYLPGQVKSIQYETNINSHIKHGNMLLKNWTKVLTLHTVLWNNAATYIIWIVWDNYWLSQKVVARILYTFLLSANFFSDVSTIMSRFPKSVFCLSCYDYIRLAILMSEACLFNCCIFP